MEPLIVIGSLASIIIGVFIAAAVWSRKQSIKKSKSDDEQFQVVYKSKH
jgi:hypothetical protein